jgi:hypothetical protein
MMKFTKVKLAERIRPETSPHPWSEGKLTNA